MPNWCSVRYCIHGIPDDVKNAKSFIEKALAEAPYQKASNPNQWMGQIVIALGSDWNQVNSRGWIEEITEIEEYDGECEFIIYSMDAWYAKNEVFDLLLEKHPEWDVSYCFCAEEPGMGIYVNTDESGLYFPEKYILEEPEDISYFESERDLIDYLEESYDEIFERMQDVEAFLKKKQKAFFHGETDAYVFLHTFSRE